MRRALTALTLILSAAAAQAEEVDLELALLTDATGSIGMDEIRFQRQGYAEALRDPAVLKAIAEGGYGRIAVAYVEWADEFSQDVVVDWTVIDGAAAAEDFGARLTAAPRRAIGRNAIGAALMTGVAMIEGNAFDGFRKVIDLSADSANNWSGPTIEAGRDAAVAAGITVNGLAILCRSCESGRAADYDLEAAFRRRIVGGPGSFVVTADGDAAFADAVRRKLILEIAGLTPEHPAAQMALSAPRP